MLNNYKHLKTNIMKTVEQITEILENQSEYDLKELWNDYQADISGEQQIYDFTDDFFEDFFSSPAEAARAVFFGKIESWNANFVTFNGYGNLEASNYVSDMISIYDLTNYINDNQDNFDNLLEA